MPPCLQPVIFSKNVLEPLIAADVPVYNAFNIVISVGDLIRISRTLNNISRFIQSNAAFSSMKHTKSGLDVN